VIGDIVQDQDYILKYDSLKSINLYLLDLNLDNHFSINNQRMMNGRFLNVRKVILYT